MGLLKPFDGDALWLPRAGAWLKSFAGKITPGSSISILIGLFNGMACSLLFRITSRGTATTWQPSRCWLMDLMRTFNKIGLSR